MANNNTIWEIILKTIKYDNTNYNTLITANQIKECRFNINNQFEPRLLCKHDTKDSRPTIFKENELCIISIKNGTYLLTKMNIYKTLYFQDINIIQLQRDDTSCILNNGNSESSFLDNLYYANVFSDILNEPITHGSLLNGRHRCSFDILINNQIIKISGSQFEIDACYESKNKIMIIEAKNKMCHDFNIRQLYYPFRFINNLNHKKEITCAFICKDKNEIFYIWTFTFINILDMTSIECKTFKKYKFIK
jgi:hypothetical protein